MSGPSFMWVHGHCVACKTFLSFNPDHVPSLRIKGIREPLCRECFASWNAIHKTAKGLPEVPLHPDAYEPKEV